LIFSALGAIVKRARARHPSRPPLLAARRPGRRRTPHSPLHKGDYAGLVGIGHGRSVYLAELTRVCTFDRPGTTLGPTEFSCSSPAPMPRTAADAVADLDAVLKAARVPGPYVLDRAQIAAYAPSPIPLSVISRKLPLPLPAGLPAGLTTAVVERAWRQAQDRLARLTPDAVQVIAERSSHYVMFSQPRLIVDQIDRVVRAVGLG